jgi:prepilin-type N-terminal cleavage/methylation domain-containing protein
MHRHRNSARPTAAPAGFTLIELIIAVAILAILLALAAPTFAEISLRSRSTNAVNALVGDLALARSEAVKRARTAYVSANGNWTDGWQVWVDENNDGVRGGADEDVLKEHGAINDPDMATSIRFALRAVGGATAGSTAITQVGFGTLGQTAEPNDGARFALCRPDGDAAASVGVQVELSGRAASQRNLATLGLGCP